MDVTCPSEQTPAIFSPLLDRSKRGSPPAGGEIPPNQTVWCKTGGRGKPLPYGCKWDGRVWDPPLRRHKGHRGPTGVADGAPSGRALQVITFDICRTVIRHCEEGHGPDVAIRFSVNRGTDSHGPSGASE